MHKFTGGEFIVMGVPGEGLDPETIDIVSRVQPSGFILFARNIKTPPQLRALTDHLRKLVKHEPIITIDQEGGRVSRLKEFMAEPPSARQLAARGDVALIKEHGVLTGKLLRLFGFNLNLAPVLDLELDPEANNSLKTRCYGSTPDQVIRNAHAFAAGMKREGILSCGKHFPGYSRACVDPHHALPSVERTVPEMNALEWIAFQRSISVVDTLMLGHVRYPQIDSSGLPASLSARMVRELVREQWQFAGCTITDDMDMGAITNEYGSAAEASAMALKAGNDLSLVCHNIKGIPEIAKALLAVDSEIQKDAFDRILKLRQRLAKPVDFSMDAFKALDRQVAKLRADTLELQAAR